MDKAWYLRFTVVLTAVILAGLALWPSLDQAGWVSAPPVVKEYFPGRINPGLDIQGGLRLMYEVEVDEYIRDRRDRTSTQLIADIGVLLGKIDDEKRDDASREQLEAVPVRVQRVGETKIRVIFEESADYEKLSRDWLQENRPLLRIENRDEGSKTLNLAFREDELEKLRETAVSQAVRTIGDRIDTLGLREATVIGRESDIIVEIPGKDQAMFDRIRGIISKTARLEFLVVDDDSSFLLDLAASSLPEGISKGSEVGNAGESKPQVPQAYLYATGEGARQRLVDYLETLELPDDRQLLLGELDPAEEDSVQAGQEAWRTYFLHETTEVTGEDVEDAFVSFDPEDNKPVVSLQFNRDGARKFEEMTGRNVKRRMAIVLDERVSSAPVIQARIGGGRAQINLGSYRDYNTVLAEANDLVVVLRAGALPAPLRPANEQLIGATLGEDSVKQGAQGAIIGVILVIVFMAVYYQVAGLVADVMVTLNLLFLLAIMAAFEATLTLPGVAAIALTVGMAVDANVLITERIREELRLGKSPRSAVDQGFGRAFWSVFDSQLTTFIAGVVLFQYGTGPIKGFAVMLMIGIVTSLFTGIFCSKVMLDWIVRGLKVQRLRVG